MKFILTILFSSLTFLVAAQNSELKLASDLWPPFTGKEKPNALAIQLVDRALDRAGIEANTEIIEFTDVISGIKEGSFDGSAALWMDESRSEIMNFSIPYLQNQLILVGRKGSIVVASSFNALIGKKVAIVGNYAYGESVNEDSGVRFIMGESDQDNLEKLLRSEVDYMLVDALLIEYLLTHQRESAAQFLEIAEIPILVKSLHLGISKDVENSEEIIARFNEEVRKMASDGSYNEILQLDWINTDVDGDGTTELVLKGDRAGTEAPLNSYDVYFQNSISQNSATNRYYIDGTIYQGWDTVPAKYKKAPQTEDSQNRSELLRLRF